MAGSTQRSAGQQPKAPFRDNEVFTNRVGAFTTHRSFTVPDGHYTPTQRELPRFGRANTTIRPNAQSASSGGQDRNGQGLSRRSTLPPINESVREPASSRSTRQQRNSSVPPTQRTNATNAGLNADPYHGEHGEQLFPGGESTSRSSSAQSAPRGTSQRRGGWGAAAYLSSGPMNPPSAGTEIGGQSSRQSSQRDPSLGIGVGERSFRQSSRRSTVTGIGIGERTSRQSSQRDPIPGMESLGLADQGGDWNAPRGGSASLPMLQAPEILWAYSAGANRRSELIGSPTAHSYNAVLTDLYDNGLNEWNFGLTFDKGDIYQWRLNTRVPPNGGMIRPRWDVREPSLPALPRKIPEMPARHPDRDLDVIEAERISIEAYYQAADRASQGDTVESLTRGLERLPSKSIGPLHRPSPPKDFTKDIAFPWDNPWRIVVYAYYQGLQGHQVIMYPVGIRDGGRVILVRVIDVTAALEDGFTTYPLVSFRARITASAD